MVHRRQAKASIGYSMPVNGSGTHLQASDQWHFSQQFGGALPQKPGTESGDVAPDVAFTVADIYSAHAASQQSIDVNKAGWICKAQDY